MKLEKTIPIREWILQEKCENPNFHFLAKFATAPTPHSELRPKPPKRKNINFDVAAIIIIIINLFIICDIISIISDIYIYIYIAHCLLPSAYRLLLWP